MTQSMSLLLRDTTAPQEGEDDTETYKLSQGGKGWAKRPTCHGGQCLSRVQQEREVLDAVCEGRGQ